MRFAVFLYGTQADYGTSMSFAIKTEAQNFVKNSTAQASINAPGYSYWGTLIDTKLGSFENYQNGTQV